MDPLTAAMLRLADGDRTAFDQVYAAVHPRISALCRRLVDGPDAEDAAQRALLRLFSRIDDFDADVGPALPWILGIAAWEARSMRRSQVRRREDPLPVAPLRGGQPDPESALLDQALMLALEEGIADLPATDREAVRAALGQCARPPVSAQTFRKRLSRAIARMRAALGRAHG